MRVSAFLNLKGGVGKTVTAINVAYILAAEYRQRVLLVDADSQANTTEFFSADPARGNLADVLTAPDGAYGCTSIQSTKYTGLDLLAASDQLMDLDLSKVEQQLVRPTALVELLSHLREIGQDYDTVLIDCPPAFSAASAAALLAADEVIIPIKLDAFSLRGMSNLMRQVTNMRRINPRLRVAGCLPTMHYRSDDTRRALDILYASDLPTYKTKIRRSNRVDGMTFAQEPLSLYSPTSAAGVDYRRFVREWLGGVNRG